MNSSGTWFTGPSPGNALVGSPSLARYMGELFVAYRKSNGYLYWRRFNGSSWSTEKSANLPATASPPVLASGEEDPDPGAYNRLQLVYRVGSAVEFATAWWDGADYQWAPFSIGQADQQGLAITTVRPAAAMFRGRLHVVGVNAPNIWYASCEMPCTSPELWTRIVQQDWSGGGDPYLEAHGTWDWRLHLWHRLHSPEGTPPALYERSKLSM